VRPVNLIPLEQRPGQRPPLRGGPLAYIIVGALVAALAGVALLVTTGNQISDSKAEIAQVKQEKAAVDARATALTGYTEFNGIRQQRVATVTSLANSRFDWERVMRELALVLPDNVWLTTLAGSDSPTTAPEGAPGITLRSSIAGPALEIVGCARSQDAVAGFVQALKDIDGVTRVGVELSALGSEEGGTESEAGSPTVKCQTKAFIAQFQMVAAFDAAPPPSESGSEEAAPSVAPEGEATTTSAEG
jgi:Tfp pilus assembly protein PilN